MGKSYLGASGLGWEVWCDGMEITQFTYFQQVGGFEVNPVAVEITYGLERLAMFIQKKRMFILLNLMVQKIKIVVKLMVISLRMLK